MQCRSESQIAWQQKDFDRLSWASTDKNTAFVCTVKGIAACIHATPCKHGEGQFWWDSPCRPACMQADTCPFPGENSCQLTGRVGQSVIKGSVDLLQGIGKRRRSRAISHGHHVPFRMASVGRNDENRARTWRVYIRIAVIGSRIGVSSSSSSSLFITPNDAIVIISNDASASGTSH